MLVATEQFRTLATQLAKYYACPDLPMVIIPHPFNSLSHDEVIKLADKFKGELLSRLVTEAVVA